MRAPGSTPIVILAGAVASPDLLLMNGVVSPLGDGGGAPAGSTPGAEVETAGVGLGVVDVIIFV